MRIFSSLTAPFSLCISLLTLWPSGVLAAETSSDSSLLRMLIGLIIVVAVIALLAWCAKRMLPGQGMRSAGLIQQVAALHLSPRERVVVLAVADRWLVVGLHAGQMTALADLPAGQLSTPLQAVPSAPTPLAAHSHADNSFAQRLQQALQQQWQSRFKSPNNPV